jgi:hypothetical protein
MVSIPYNCLVKKCEKAGLSRAFAAHGGHGESALRQLRLSALLFNRRRRRWWSIIAPIYALRASD